MKNSFYPRVFCTFLPPCFLLFSYESVVFLDHFFFYSCSFYLFLDHYLINFPFIFVFSIFLICFFTNKQMSLSSPKKKKKGSKLFLGDNDSPLKTFFNSHNCHSALLISSITFLITISLLGIIH